MANPDVGIHATETRAFARPASVGQVADNRPSNIFGDVINRNPQAAQVDSLTVTGAALTYTLTVGGIVFVLAGSVASVAAATDELADSWNEDPILRSWMAASSDGISVVTLTGNLPGVVVDIVESDGNVTYASVTAADEADPVDFGRGCVGFGFATPANNVLDPDGTILRGGLADAASMTAQVETWTIGDPGIGQFIGARLEIVGVSDVFQAQVPWSASLDATLDNLAAVLNAALTDEGANAYVSVAGPAGAPGAGELRFTAAIAGVEFESLAWTDDAAAYPVITVSSNKSIATSVPRAFEGVSVRATDEVPSTVGTTASQYGPNRGVRLLKRGRIWIENSEVTVPTWGGRVFLSLATATAGRFYAAAGANRIPLPFEVARWERKARAGESDSLAILEIDAYARS